MRWRDGPGTGLRALLGLPSDPELDSELPGSQTESEESSSSHVAGSEALAIISEVKDAVSTSVTASKARQKRDPILQLTAGRN